MATDVPEQDNQESSPVASGGDLSNQFNKIPDLMGMEEGQLQALWDTVPSERQQAYEDAYESALGSLGTGDVTDDQAMGLIEQIMAHYESGQVPIMGGKCWVQVPTRVREMVEAGEDVSKAAAPAKSKSADPGKKAKPAAAGTKPSLPMIAAGVMGVILLFCLIFTVINRMVGGDEGSDLSDDDLTGTALAEEIVGPTPTFFLLADTDRIIRDGEDFSDYYPVLLEIIPEGESSRVMVVQQRTIAISEWEYEDRNADTASWVAGLLVRPVLGVPYTEANSSLISELSAGDTVLLHMSTGTTLSFEIETTTKVDRQDTSIFRQVSPGIVLVLLGDPTTSERLVVFGRYPPEQELLREDIALNLANAAILGNVGEETVLDENSGATITVLDSYTSLGQEGAELPEDLAYLFVDVELHAGLGAVETSGMQISIIDSTGVRYSPVTFGLGLANYPSILGQQIPPDTTVTGTIGYLVPRTIAGASTLTVRIDSSVPATAFSLIYDAPGALIQEPPEVVVLNVETRIDAEDVDQLIVSARIFNPNNQVVTFRQQDIFVVFSPTAPGRGLFPSGAQTFASEYNGGSPVFVNTIDAGASLDIEVVFTWDGSAFVGISILDYQFVAQLQ